MSRTYAAKLAELLEKPCAALDDLLFDWPVKHRVKGVYQLCPALAIQQMVLDGDTSDSDIAHERDSLRMKKPIRNKLKREVMRLGRQFLDTMRYLRKRIFCVQQCVPFD